MQEQVHVLGQICGHSLRILQGLEKEIWYIKGVWKRYHGKGERLDIMSRREESRKSLVIISKQENR